MSMASIARQGLTQEYKWMVLDRYTNSGNRQNPYEDIVSDKKNTATSPDTYPVREVWYLEDRYPNGWGNGWAWEVTSTLKRSFS